MTLKINKVSIKDKVKIIDAEIEENGEMTNSTTVKIIKECGYMGEVTKIEDNLIYVAFITDDGWVTQVFKPEELQEVK